ncbi:MAG: methionine--tRNA ligase [Treponema sp. CETP13]|nr:MAG: methionine--tRNA ligase [Treponema sp. CETP13]
MKRRLVTSALPYVNNVPHLGNCIQVLSADVFSRFCRSRGYDTLYVCGTDEYGTATETKALEVGKSPRELCDYYHAIHKEIYDWFGINFDNFGRTSNPQQTEIVQQMFKDVYARGFIKENTIEQLYCPKCERFLADRYVRGTCPKCGYEDAGGDQCENCGALLDPTELVEPHCKTCGSTPTLKSTKHLYIDLPRIQKEYAPWMEKASVEGRWAKNALQMTQAWIRDGLHERAITRDLKWGIPVPLEGFENKVFYVWFDAPIGYISITKELDDKLKAQGASTQIDWKSWWLPTESEDPSAKKDVDLFQFIGKDNIPFHTVIFPSTLIGSGRDWTKLYHMSSTEYLNYENGKFSKSKGVGVFGTDAKESGIPADAWRFYIFYNRPEKSDTQFTWKDFQDKLNSELIGNLGNLVNRTTTFISKFYDGIIPQGSRDEKLWSQVETLEKKMTDLLEWAKLKDSFHEIFKISSIANKYFQDGEPWKTRNENPKAAANLLWNLSYVIKDLMIMAHPFLPHYSEEVLGFFGKKGCTGKIGQPQPEGFLNWSDLGKTEGLSKIEGAHIIFTPLDDEKTDEYRQRYAGSQEERQEAEKKGKPNKKKKHTQEKLSSVELFNKNISLRVAKVLSVERHPDADKLYVEKVDDGSGEERIICSGLVPYLKEEDILGKNIVIAYNLKGRKMRGVESRGMLLAADYKNDDGSDAVEILECPWAAPGDELTLEGSDVSYEKPESINADKFFAVPIKAVNGVVKIEDKALVVAGKPVCTTKALNSEIS